MARSSPPAGGPDAAEVENSADEGLLIVSAGFRLTLKNLIIVRALRDGEAWDEGDLLAALAFEIDNLIDERQQDADFLDKTIKRARRRSGRAGWHDDYRQQDVPTLELRRAADRRMIERLQELAEDDEYLRGQLALARDAALDDVMSAKFAAQPRVVVDDEYRRDRGRRVELVKRDLDRLDWLMDV